MKHVVALAIAIAVPAFAMPLIDKGTHAMKPDFSNVKSVADAQALASKGEFEKVLLFPAEFGGKDIPQNITYIPPAAARAKDLITGTLVRYVKQGLIDKLTVEPEYKGDSFVPSRIVMHATHHGRTGGFDPALEVW